MVLSKIYYQPRSPETYLCKNSRHNTRFGGFIKILGHASHLDIVKSTPDFFLILPVLEALFCCEEAIGIKSGSLGLNSSLR